MKIWTANSLNTKADVYQRGVFRFFWCLVGFVIVIPIVALLDSKRLLVTLFFSLIPLFVVPVGGMLFDLYRLKIQK